MKESFIYLLQFNDQNQVQDKTMNTRYIEKNERAQSKNGVKAICITHKRVQDPI